ncbi:MAG: peptide deformylase [Myxococcales bacterium]|nr:peptide deformylase [Myxococcales bacterium]|tara:strand:- start:676 stop:1251 length:576 start_codon:yes stop_codon:yes gene_type:complete
MAIREIALIGEPVLREQTREISSEEIASSEIQETITDMIETMHHANGAGIAANQIFSPLRICVIEVSDNPRYPYKPNIPLTILINPQITPVGTEMFENYEGCLSVPNLRGKVERYCQIEIKALDRNGQPIEETICGITAGTFQHEIDHLDGKLFVDRVKNTASLCTWDAFKKYHEKQVEKEVKTIVEKWGA